VFCTEGTRVIRTPVQSPRANPFAERFVGTTRRECLDRLLIFSRRHLEQVLTEYIEHYNEHRSHRSLGQRSPQQETEPGPMIVVDPVRIRRRDRLGGVIHEYELAA
jgi:putative transposase